MLRNQVGISNDLASLLYSRSSAEIITSRTLPSGDNNFTNAGQLVNKIKKHEFAAISNIIVIQFANWLQALNKIKINQLKLSDG
jgi:hypothetical protein